ncbi:MAG: hypothetical protein EU532_04500 [Promethearchaeota archaeon]|nr:MAG: hypothetical protein EU532_04500 [Candidatus Lokiarchaeota archaeon]
MIFQGLFNILDIYSSEIDLFYSNIDKYFREKLNPFLGEKTLEKSELDKIVGKVLKILKKEFLKLGFNDKEIEEKFLDPYLEIQNKDVGIITNASLLYEKKISPIIYEIFLEKIVDYLVDNTFVNIVLNLKSMGLLPFEFIFELINLKKLFKKSPEKTENLLKYIQIRDKIIKKFRENKDQIESLEELKDPKDKLQLMYLIFRIIDFFHLQKIFDFSHIKAYLKKNIDEWLNTIPLVTLKNPDQYFCGVYLAKHLDVEIDYERVKAFLMNLYEENIDEFEAPVIEATDRLYCYFKTTELLKLWLNDEQISRLMKIEESFFEPQYLKNLETSQLVVILKIYNVIGEFHNLDKQKRKAIIDEIETRVTLEGIKQYRDGFVSSEATYYVLFCNYMKNSLDKLKDYDLLGGVVSRIYRNLEILNFSQDTNYDLVSEIFYSCESLKLLNCIETKQMIIHLAKYLFPNEVLEKISSIENITATTPAKFRHLKVNRITGETIY